MTPQTLKEVNVPYTVNPDDEMIGRETVLVRRNGEPIAAVVPYAEYANLLAFKQSRDYAAFQQGHDAYLRLHAALLKTHKGQWVAMLNGRVVESDSSQWMLAKRVYRRFGYRPIYMTRVADQPIRTVQMGGPTIVR